MEVKTKKKIRFGQKKEIVLQMHYLGFSNYYISRKLETSLQYVYTVVKNNKLKKQFKENGYTSKELLELLKKNISIFKDVSSYCKAQCVCNDEVKLEDELYPQYSVLDLKHHELNMLKAIL